MSSVRSILLAGGLLACLSVLPVQAGTLPAPYVSRALDAVLIPIDGGVRSAFGLADADKGVLVLAVSPGGVADQAGIAPGDVIEKAHGRAILDPILLDEVVWYWIQKGSFDFGFDGWRGGQAASYTTTITLESYSTVIDITTVSSWTSYSYESFSYAEYTTEYSEEISQSYESSETTIEETTSSEEFASEETTEETATEETATEETTTDEAAIDEAATDEAATDETADSDNDGTPDTADTDDDNDGTPDTSDSDDNGDGVADE